MVPGSTFKYGSNFCSDTRRPRLSSRQPMEAAAMPLPSDETTPPVTKIYLAMDIPLSAFLTMVQKAPRHARDLPACRRPTIRTRFPPRGCDDRSQSPAIAPAAPSARGDLPEGRNRRAENRAGTHTTPNVYSEFRGRHRARTELDSGKNRSRRLQDWLPL